MPGLAIDWVIVRDVVSVLFTGLGAFFYRKTERSRKVNNGTIERLNGHVEAVDRLESDVTTAMQSVMKMRKRMAAQARRIQSLETSRENAANERRQLQSRIEVLEHRGA